MNRLAVCLAGIVPILLLAGISVGHAHHSFAMFDQTVNMLVEGRVVRWDYNNPHAWLHIELEDENGEMQRWSFEGGAPVRTARAGVTGNTFKRGEFVRVVASPIRDGRRAGAMCFVVKEDGSTVRPNDGTCDPFAVIATWEENGWLDSTGNLGVRPHEGND